MNKMFRVFFVIIVLLASHTEFVGASTGTDPLDLRIVLDVSQHAGNLLPQQQHLNALSVLIARLPDSARAGVWAYGRYVNHLIQHGPVNHQWRLQAIAAVSSIRSVAQYRNLAEALNQASYDRGQSKPRRHILLVASGGPELTDKPEVNLAQLQFIRGPLLAELMDAGFVIHTLSIGKDSSNLLQGLARETGGLHLRLDSAELVDELVKLVADYLLQPTRQQIIDTHFRVDSDVEEFGALLFDRSAQTRAHLQTPSGELLGLGVESDKEPGYQQLEGQGFRFIRVSNPATGSWIVKDTAVHDSSIYIQSRELLEIKSAAASYLLGQNGQLVFFNSSAGSFPPSVPELQELKVKSVANNGLNDTIPVSIIDSGGLVAKLDDFSKSGVYQLLAVTGDGDGRRILDSAVQIIRPYALRVVKSRSEGLLHYNISVRLDEPDLVSAQSSLIAKVIGRVMDKEKDGATSSEAGVSGEWQTRILTKISDDEWLLQLDDDGVSSHYEVVIDFNGVSFTGRKEQYRTKPLLIELERLKIPGIQEAMGNAIASDLVAGQGVEAKPRPALTRNFAPRKSLAQQEVNPTNRALMVPVVSVLMVFIFFAIGWRLKKGGGQQESPGLAQQELDITEVGRRLAVAPKHPESALKIEITTVEMSPDINSEEEVANLFEVPLNLEAIENDDDLKDEMKLAEEWGQLEVEYTKPGGKAGVVAVEQNRKEPDSND